ncbi:parasite-infected erythrocyte surface protein [Plasmodium yoelii]|uniref:Parasite-infected erythrocyte surface protein n=3 Tax=Plasmodium yoelii TaxID=5861 RepID=A0AAF0AYA8_PLAYO|nr:parasite-infected erythrocyte surface protein [Plasmodium yoelii]WBY54762.1 parasite-infected erythrocyte surface protein [Plasmodium yoelii yoelii]CDU16120.1 parasite-infected erythrocyte surface protein [Plasmodium yoelii]VTZ71745.1 parasite-infected erythrocyte surface protein [Plasmodium yoelii]|eukprot:XP_724401.2 parasite-infected erythrocyte surface protein [Plasmodium yoelii]
MNKYYARFIHVSIILIFVLFINKCENESPNKNENFISPIHSFKSPFQVEGLNNGWVLDYSAASTNKYLVLIPNVYNRRGLLYNSNPIKSDVFDINFSFNIYKKYYKESIDSNYYKNESGKHITYNVKIDEKDKTNGFAFWILENQLSVKSPGVSEEQIIIDEEDVILYGYKKIFNGICIYFQLRDNDLSVYALINNGNKSISLNNNSAKNYNLSLLQNNGLISVKIVAQKNDIRIYLFNLKTSTYIHSLTIKKNLPKENYIGFSSFNFNEDTSISITNVNKYLPTFVGITDFHVYTNYMVKENEQKIIYENDDPENLNVKTKNDEEINYNELNGNNLMNEILSSQNINLSSQEEMLKTMLKIIQDFISYQVNNDKKVLQNISFLKENIHNMQDEIKQIRKNITNKSDPKNLQKIFTSELSGLKNLFHSHAQHHKKNIEDITNRLTSKIDNNQELKILAQKAQKLEHIINKGNNTSYFFSIAFAALIVITLIMIYKKIRDVEKKHIL